MSGRPIPVAAQVARRAALAAASRQRPLTTVERREADNLDHRAYMRAWRANNAAVLR